MPSTAPLERVPFASNQFRINGLWLVSMLATFFNGSRLVLGLTLPNRRETCLLLPYLRTTKTVENPPKVSSLLYSFNFIRALRLVVCFLVRFSVVLVAASGPEAKHFPAFWSQKKALTSSRRIWSIALLNFPIIWKRSNIFGAFGALFLTTLMSIHGATIIRVKYKPCRVDPEPATGLHEQHRAVFIGF